MGYYILLVMYAFLLLFYAAHYKEPVIKSWPILQGSNVQDTTVPKTCRDHDECPDHYKCVSGQCYPQFLRGEACSEITGKWTVMRQYENNFAVCQCTYPHLFTSKYFGGNCNVSVACLPNGQYNERTGLCDCSPGYKAVGLSCLRMSVLEMDTRYACDTDEFEHAARIHGFHAEYAGAHRDKKCFRAPCKFDAFSGLPLKNAYYEPGVGCICDPTLGQFGVRIRGTSVTPFRYLADPGYSACASIYQTPLEKPIAVDVYGYFYIMDRPPIVFLQYKDVNPHKLIPSLRKVHTGHLQIAQEFPYDYMQTFFRKGMWRQARRLRKIKMPLLNDYAQHQWVLATQTHHMEYCRYLTRERHMSKVTKYNEVRYRIKDYDLLYNFPACYVGKNETGVADMYRGRYVLNPFQLSFRETPGHARFNGLHVGFDGQQWTIDFAPPYKVDTYMTAALASNHVPRITNGIVDFIESAEYYKITPHMYQTLENKYQVEKVVRSHMGEPEFF